MRTQETGKEQTGNGQIGNGQIGNEHIPTLYTHYKWTNANQKVIDGKTITLDGY